MENFKMSKKIFPLLVLILVTLFSTSVLATNPSSNDIYEGIDVSNWQGYINYAEVKNSGIDIVYIKASQGSNYVDPYFKINYRNAKSNGLKVGLYHFLTARSVEEARQEADYFASVIASTSPDCKLAMDFENFGDLTAEEINEISIAFLEAVKEKTNKEVIIYSDQSNALNIFSNELATEYPLWVAEYGVENPGRTNWNEWQGFQYTDLGVVAGINGYVDRDRFTQDIFLSDITEIPQMPDVQQPFQEITYIVKRGNTLFSIAKQYGTTVNELVQINQISNPNLIYPGQNILIPIRSSEQLTNEIVYIVKSGDTLFSIARQYGTNGNILIQNNQILNPNLIYPGQRIVIERQTNNLYETNHIIYTIRKGDTLSKLALEFNTTVQRIAELNNIQNVNLIFIGERVRIPN